MCASVSIQLRTRFLSELLLDIYSIIATAIFVEGERECVFILLKIFLSPLSVHNMLYALLFTHLCIVLYIYRICYFPLEIFVNPLSDRILMNVMGKCSTFDEWMFIFVWSRLHSLSQSFYRQNNVKLLW